MAQRRMFSKSITNSSRFLMMPPTSQLLYIHLAMNADDDGFVEHFSIMRMVEAKPDDLGVLSGRGFVKIFDERVLVITDWSENNYIRADRYTPSKYLSIYKNELSELARISGESGIPVVDQMATQVRLGKGSIYTAGTSPASGGSSNEERPVLPSGRKKRSPSFTCLEDFLKSPQSHIRIIGGYLKVRGIRYDTPEEWSSAARRWMRVASEIAKFGDKRVDIALEAVNDKYPDFWTLDTLYKYLTSQPTIETLTT